MEHARHVFRVALVLLVVVVVVVVGRSFLVPRSYGTYGNYRFDNVAEQASARSPLHAGAASCAECHDDRSAALAKGRHAVVSCEVCHAPLGVHVKAGDVVAAMPVDRSVRLCGFCHRKIDGRPAGFPQVVFEKHVEGGLGPKGCLDCHDPHSPKA
jgi:formate-dependent nitrite reductase cytochrome c552 subunit